MRYTTKECEIDAVQFNGRNFDEIKEFTGHGLGFLVDPLGLTIVFKDHNHEIKGHKDDYVIKNAYGDITIMRADVFESVFKRV